MPDYFFTAVTPHGRKVTDVIQVETVAAAHQQLLNDGYSDIVMHSDDISARYLRYDEQSQRAFTPQEFLEISRSRGWQAFWVLSRILFKKTWLLTLIGILLFGLRRVMGDPFRGMDLFAIAIIFMPLLISAVTQLVNRQLKVYNEFIEARAWAQWDRVLEIAPRVKGIAPEELAFQVACAHAGLGNLERGLKVVEPFSDGKRMPLHLYHGRLSDLYTMAGRYTEMLPCLKKAYEIEPNSPAVMIDLAMAMLRLQTDLPQCKQLADRVSREPLNELLSMMHKYLEAVIALEDNRPSRAEELLNEAFRMAQPMLRLTPLMGSVQDRMHMYMALIQKRLGNQRSATEHYRKAAPRLIAFRFRDLLDRCRRELGAGIIESEDN